MDELEPVDEVDEKATVLDVIQKVEASLDDRDKGSVESHPDLAAPSRVLFCGGVNQLVDEPCNLFGDNLNVIQNANNPEADIKKKHVAISFHLVREAIAAGIVAPFWLQGKHNLVDIMTKQIGSSEFLLHVETLFWKPSFIASSK